MSIQEAYTQLMYKLFELYDEREAKNISEWIIENITGQKKIDRIVNKKFPLNEHQQQLLQSYTDQLLNHKPVQYVVQEAWFCGMKLFVDENVLIPRPETEELVNWIIADSAPHFAELKNNTEHFVLDIGTGSGCIAVALKKRFPNASLFAVDISLSALDIAERNAEIHNTPIHFYHFDILNRDEWLDVPKIDIITSNPPYIMKNEAKQMRRNVLQYEPHTALFVPNNDAMIFYKNIAVFGVEHLKENGKLFLEINEASGKDVSSLLLQFGYKNIELRKDLQGKERMVKAVINN